MIISLVFAERYRWKSERGKGRRNHIANSEYGGEGQPSPPEIHREGCGRGIHCPAYIHALAALTSFTLYSCILALHTCHVFLACIQPMCIVPVASVF